MPSTTERCRLKFHRPIMALIVSISCAGPAAADPAPKIDTSKFAGTLVEDVVVPVPSEVFSVLDKLGEPNWKAELRGVKSHSLGKRPQIALLLGTVIADGLIAVQAQDAETVKEIGREVLRLSKAIGVQESVKARSKAIIDSADARDWRRVRQELDKALQDVRSAMIELNDEQLAHLVSLGGWIRGTEVLSSIVSKGYSQDGAELLRQPGLVTYFEDLLAGMSSPLQSHHLVGLIRVNLDEIRPLIDVEDGRKISEDSVTRVNGITSTLVMRITSEDPSATP